MFEFGAANMIDLESFSSEGKKLSGFGELGKLAKHYKSGGADGTRTRDLRRDRPAL